MMSFENEGAKESLVKSTPGLTNIMSAEVKSSALCSPRVNTDIYFFTA